MERFTLPWNSKAIVVVGVAFISITEMPSIALSLVVVVVVEVGGRGEGKGVAVLICLTCLTSCCCLLDGARGEGCEECEGWVN